MSADQSHSTLKYKLSIEEINNKTHYFIQKHFRLTNYQLIILLWIKGLWTGILLSLVLHHFISH